MIKKSICFLFLITLNCGSTVSNINKETSKYLFTINFMGQLFVEKEVTLKINDSKILENKLFGNIPYPQTRGIHEISIGCRKGNIDLMKRHKTLTSKSFQIDSLNNVRITLEVDNLVKDFIINAKNGKHYYIKYDIGSDIKMTQLDW